MTTKLTSRSSLRSRLTGRSLPRPQKAGWGAVVSGLIVVIALAWALVPGLFASGDPVNSGSTAPLLPPSTEHWFGTDAVGRDLYTRVVWGTRQSLLGALVAVLLGMIIGTLLGVIAGSSRARRGSGTGARKGSWVDTLIMRIVDVLLAIPALLLSLSVIIVLGYGSINAAIAVGVTNVAMFARTPRSMHSPSSASAAATARSAACARSRVRSVMQYKAASPPRVRTIVTGAVPRVSATMSTIWNASSSSPA